MMARGHVVTGHSTRAGAQAIALVAACVMLAPVVSCGRARAVTNAAPTESLRYPRDAARFAAEPLSDSTLSFAAEDARWVAVGMLGIAVDPTRGDALVAKLEITRVTNGRVEALVTGQTTRVAPGHVVLLIRPRSAWWRQRLYWIGTLSGIVVAGGLALLLS